MSDDVPSFIRSAGRVLNSGQSRTLLLTGNIHDLYRSRTSDGIAYLPLMEFLVGRWDLEDFIIVVYELNGPIRFLRECDSAKVRDAWLRWRVGMSSDEIDVQRMLRAEETDATIDEARQVYDDSLRKSLNNPTLALELLRQLCQAARSVRQSKRCLREKLLILVEGADMLMPDAPIVNLSDSDRQRVMILHDWFCDPGFANGEDAVVMICESRSQLHQRIARLPQMIEVELPSPTTTDRRLFIEWFRERHGTSTDNGCSIDELVGLTAGLSLQALMQLLRASTHDGRALTPDDVVAKVEQFIKSQLGEEMIEFKKPTHSLEDVVGFSRLKGFLNDDLIPRFRRGGSAALTGAAVCGPIGGGKTFLFEAVASEMDSVVLVLKSIRSKWFGETDVLFERLKRVLGALSRVVIFIDEADTQLGGLGSDTHETERRLVGRIQALMSDSTYRGRVFWLLITARVHRLSPDLRRPGRVGDLIIPVLDPEGVDREAFVGWMLEPTGDLLSKAQLADVSNHVASFSAAEFASVRAELKVRADALGRDLLYADVLEPIEDRLVPAIETTRRYQTLQALINCTRRSLLPDPTVTDHDRAEWRREIAALEAAGEG